MHALSHVAAAAEYVAKPAWHAGVDVSVTEREVLVHDAGQQLA